MGKRRLAMAGGAAAMLLVAGLAITRAQDPVTADRAQERAQARVEEATQMPVSDPSCTFFGPERERFVAGSNARSQGQLTASVGAQLAYSARAVAANVMPSAPGGSRTDSLDHPSSNTIDRYIFPALSAAGVAAAPPTTDWEFVRRVYLDLTGRIPTPAQTAAFINDTSMNKRSTLVNSLVGSPAWVDKWTVWFSDLYQNNSDNAAGTRRFIQGVTAFNGYIRSSLQSNKPYNQMASEIITTQGTDSFTQGEVNYLVGGVVSGGPVQDIYDQQIANTASTFLGLSNLNCLLCHDGRGHLDQINLWGYYTSRKQAWGMSSFLSHTATAATTVSANLRSFSLQDTGKLDYALGSTTGNRPPRTGTGRVSPVYILGNAKPATGENYRAALARMMTSDFQFARAAVNYVWEYFFTVGIVSPSNQFDPYRLDPNNPPDPAMCPMGAPCTLQPSNAALLNALAQDFVNSNYDVQALMKEIVNSNAYQLSSRYNGTWDPSTASLFGRKLVRRLWSEEVHDAITTSSGQLPTYTSGTNWGPVNYAMQLPEPLNTPDGGNGAVNNFLNAFLRGNRDDQPRKPDGSISQSLGLMNDSLVMNRIAPAAAGLLKTTLAMPAAQDGVVGQGGNMGGLVDTLFLTVLSRHPTDTELSTALANLKTNRTQEAQNLLWSLYNKVDFVFNY
ncbi:MAG TPA: DUF1549 domain-containing protein [Bryobacteraceae bacterium]|jgi:hypothetical protein